MMFVGLATAVYCDSKYCGVINYLIVQLTPPCLTYLVVKPDNLPLTTNRMERLAPITLMTAGSKPGAWLTCTLKEFVNLLPFTETYFTEVPASDYGSLEYGYWYPPLGSQNWIYVPVIRYNTPPGEFAVGRQTQIETKDGHIGQFMGFVVNLDTKTILSLEFQRGHLWERKRESLPISQVERLEGNTIYLNISKSDL